MPKLSERAEHNPFKAIYIGASGTGKTGSLISLLRAGYKLRIIDLDNGLDALQHHIEDEDKSLLDLVEYETIRDPYTFDGRSVKVKGSPKTVTKVFKLLDEWSDGTKPAEWGTDTFLVLDSLTTFGQAAYAWARAAEPSVRHKQIWYGAGQELIEAMVAALTSKEFNTNVLIISHVDLREEDGITKGFVSSLGKALGPKLPRYVNTMLLAETSGTGKNVKRKIKTFPTSTIDLKNPAPMRLEAEYPLETGLAEIVSKLKQA